ncbi:MULTISPECIES: TetR/AcrR family transcriptional regulator [Mesorhizobium]|uniref:TetR/AcrR family transcriptional regulator n=1 Tax=Mesorhizobium denitrificans TaxID=2294114 RepID=A0A371XCL5_9HYPH|nr:MULTISPECIES: TetR/AcrR family transcriptional regulator [Mesorhizobium]RFC66979.1 TetR/AcrR family transcriptional regulator [Mesorhizobium denitrificans]
MDQKTNETGWRGSPDAWLQAAYDALIDTGVDGVRILPLAKRLNLSRTSFYWFFQDREALLSALVTRWKDKNTGAIVKRSEAYADSIAEAMLNVFDCWLDTELFDSQLEFAIRSWALQSSDVLVDVQMADQLRLEALTQLFVRFGYDAVVADVRARTTYLIQIGYITMQTREDVAVRMKRIPSYVEIFTGQAPEPRELARFFARHEYEEQTRTG